MTAGPATSPIELAQAELLGWLVGNRYLTPDGLAAVRARLADDPAHQSLASRAVLMTVIRLIAREGGWPPSDDPHWPPPDDGLWNLAAIPDVPDDASSIDLGGRW